MLMLCIKAAFSWFSSAKLTMNHWFCLRIDGDGSKSNGKFFAFFGDGKTLPVLLRFLSKPKRPRFEPDTSSCF